MTNNGKLSPNTSLCKILLANQVFRGREKFSTTYAIVSFFFSRPFNENSKFLENCPYDFYEILHSHSTPKGPLRVQRHQNRMTRM